MDRLVAEFRSTVVDGRVRGYASVFGQVAPIGQGWEQIDPAAFDRALLERQEVALLVNHEGLPLARTGNGSLILGVDEHGLTVDAALPDTTLGRDVRTLLGAGLLDKMSFGFVPVAERMVPVGDTMVRTITDVDLFDVSIVTFPAYAGTDVWLRSREVLCRGPRATGQAALIRARAIVERNK